MVKTLCVTAAWKGEVRLSPQALRLLKESNAKSLALFASAQFLELDALKKQLSEAGISVRTTQAKRAAVAGQILGCDAYHDSFLKNIIDETDAVLYVGDGMFHPKALLLAQIYSKKRKPVLIWNPVSQSLESLKEEIVRAQTRKIEANIRRFMSAQTIGIIITTKPGQQYLDAARSLKKKLENEGKRAYLFLADTIDYSHLENYNFVQAWVNTACPRIGTDDITAIAQPLLNLREALDPVKHLERLD